MSYGGPRFPWFALLVGVIIGFGGGLYYAWFLDPVERVNITPGQLTTEDRQLYILLVGEAYLQEVDVERARARLAATGERDVAQMVSVMADAAYLRGDDPAVTIPLTTLAEALGAQPLAADVFSGTVAPTAIAQGGTATATFEGVPSLTPTDSEATATRTPLPPTLTPTVDFLADAEFDLVARDDLCEDSTRRTGLLQIFVYDGFDNGVPAVEILIEWGAESERIFTGLKPDIDPGYADFRMEADQVYTVTLVGLSEPVVGLESRPCRADSGELVVPTIQLVFEPAVDVEE